MEYITKLINRKLFPCMQMETPDLAVTYRNVSYVSIVNLTQTNAVFIKRNTKQVILYCHGNSSNLTSLKTRLVNMSNIFNMSVMAFDYPESIDQISAINNAAVECYQYLIENDFMQNNIIVWGKSIGTGCAAWLANKYWLKHVILVSPYKSLKTLLRERCCYFTIANIDDWDTEANIQNLDSLILIIHGDKDKTISLSHSIALSEDNYHVILEVVDGSHNLYDECDIVYPIYSKLALIDYCNDSF